MMLIVGLGNPGSRYEGTRHNVGFAVVDVLAKSASCGRFQKKFDAELTECVDGDQRILLLKPLTFMNLSGRSVRQALDFYQGEVSSLLVVCDDFNLPLGQLRVRGKGTHGGHNGLRDIQSHLGTTEYARIRLGVGAPDGGDAADYVLDRFRPGERAVVDDMILRAAQAASVWIARGIDACMNDFNRREKDNAAEK